MNLPPPSDLGQLFHKLETGDNWVGVAFGPLIERLSFAEACARPLPGKKNIAEILLHIMAWREFVVKRLQGDEAHDLIENSPQDWPSAEGMIEGEWKDLQMAFRAQHHTLLDLLDGMLDAKLFDKVAGRDYDFRYLIEGLAQHDLYHFGQIGLLKAAIKDGS